MEKLFILLSKLVVRIKLMNLMSNNLCVRKLHEFKFYHLTEDSEDTRKGSFRPSREV